VSLWKPFKERHSSREEAAACLPMAEGGSKTSVGETVEQEILFSCIYQYDVSWKTRSCTVCAISTSRIENSVQRQMMFK